MHILNIELFINKQLPRRAIQRRRFGSKCGDEEWSGRLWGIFMHIIHQLASKLKKEYKPKVGEQITLRSPRPEF